MRLTKCENKHFYDADKYDECPHCARKKAARPGTPAQAKTASQKTVALIQDTTTGTRENSSPYPQPDLPAPGAEEGPLHAKVTTQLLGPQGASHSGDAEDTAAETDRHDPSAEEADAAPSPAASDLAQAVASSSMSVHTGTAANASQKTVAFYDVGGVDPVVGWLVCVIGEYVGECFNLKAGQNFIGRSLSMDVALINEKSVSREFHAGIIFDPNAKQFFAVPGQSNGLTYINGQLLFSAVPLKSYDKIQLGKSTYIFMAFAGDDFMWDTYIGK